MTAGFRIWGLLAHVLTPNHSRHVSNVVTVPSPGIVFVWNIVCDTQDVSHGARIYKPCVAKLVDVVNFLCFFYLGRVGSCICDFNHFVVLHRY